METQKEEIWDITNIFIARDIIMVYTMREKLHVLSNWRRGQTDQDLALSNVNEIPGLSLRLKEGSDRLSEEGLKIGRTKEMETGKFSN